MSCISYYFLIVSIPLFVTTQLKATNFTAGIVAAAFTFSGVVARPFTGYTLDRYGRKVIYIIAILIFALLYNAYLLAATVSIILFLRMLHGISWGVITTSSNTVAFDILPISKRGEGIGYFALTTTMAMAIGPLFALMFINQSSFNTMFLVAGGISFIGFVSSLIVKYPEFIRNKNKDKFSISNYIEKKALPISITVMILLITYGGLLSFVSIYGKEINIKNPGIFFIVYASGIALSRLLSGKVFDRYGPKPIMIYGGILLIIGFPMLALIQNYWGFLISAFLLGSGNGVFFPTCQAMIDKLADVDRRGVANSTYLTAVDMGLAIGMFFMGFLSVKISISSSFLVCALIAFISLIIFLTYVLKDYNTNIKAKALN